MVKIAIISDLHVGAKARRYDFQPGARAVTGVAPYLDEFKSFISSQSVSADLLFVSGDIANQAHPDEYALAGKKIAEIADALQVGSGNIIFVPGNHDVCWDVQKLNCVFWKGKRFLPIQEILAPALGWSSTEGASLFEPPYAVVMERSGVKIILVNSAYKDDWKNPADGSSTPHHGSFAPESLDFLQSQIPSLKAHKPAFSVLVTHHHILPISEPDPFWQDFSMMNNSALLLDFAADAEVDLIVHGHKHWPRFRTHQEQPKPLFAILGAGSFSAEIHESLSARVFNKFHLLELDGRDGAGNACGRVRTWSYHAGDTWRPSARENGIGHTEPFGFYRSDSDILAAFQTAYSKVMAGATGPLDVDALLAEVEDIRYIADHRVDAALQAIASEVGARVLTDPATDRRYIL